ncbi:MAG TPA: hypothetical protein VMF69_05760 [Gemmataceae bacterium]|nr:hypothetical protein [Gemmataceae bacterium]
MKCLCSNRSDIRCDSSHCDLAGPGKPGDPTQCRVCWLRLNKPPSAPSPPPRSAPCWFLGEVVDKAGCACPAKWLRKCAIHTICTLDQCKSCPDYEAT